MKFLKITKMPICADLEFLVPGADIPVKELGIIDTGNNFNSLISREILDKHGIEFCPAKLSAYSVDLKKVNIIGYVELKFRFAGTQAVFTEIFYVPEVTSRLVNLGSDFLKKNKINICLDEDKFEFCGESVPINSCLQKQVVAEIQKIPILSGRMNSEIPSKPTLPGIKEGGGFGELYSTKYNVKLLDKTIFYPGGSTAVVHVTGLKNDGLWYVSPNSSKMTSGNGIMIIEGVYQPRKDGSCVVNVVNASIKPITLLRNVKMGHCFIMDNQDVTCNKTINELDKPEKLSGQKMHERVQFIIQKLKLDENQMIKENPELKPRIIKICLENFDIFSMNDSDIGDCRLMTYNIELLPGAKPVKARNIPLNPEYDAKLKEQLTKWLDAGIIEEGFSDWSSPIFAVKKKAAPGAEAKLRFVIDFRNLNNVTKRVAWPLPLISDNLTKLGSGKVFSTLDLTAAYHSMTMDEDSKPLTAFSAANRMYLFNRLPFGLCNAPSLFCALMDKVLSILPGMYGFCISYLDDLIVFSSSPEEHVEHLQALFQVLRQVNLKLNLDKCDLLTRECHYLGHIISADGLKMNPAYLERIKDWGKPRTGKELQKFLGFTNYYRGYFADYAKRSCMLDSHRNDTIIKWTEELNRVWTEFMEMFKTEMCKGYPQWDNPNLFIVDVDYSSQYFAGIISQEQDGVERVFGVCSKKCNAAEQNYPSYKGELGALVYALKNFLHFCRFREFLVRTDSISLVHYKRWAKGSINGVTYRWITFLQSFDFTVIHRQGTKHVNVDYLSRTELDCKDHRLKDCQECRETDNKILDPYLDDSPFLDQIYSIMQVHSAEDEADVEFVWQSSLQQDEILNEIRLWILERRQLSSYERAELSGRKELLYNLIGHMYVLEGVVIFRQPLAEGGFVERPVVPLSLYNDIFDSAHGGYGSGHRGVQETIRKINERFFMPGVNKFVESRIRSCITCLKKAGSNPKHVSPITHSVQSSEVFANMSVDLVGPWTPCYHQGQTVKFVLIMVCLFSRYVFTCPLVDAKTETTVKAILENFVPTYGLFRALRSDRGTNFTSSVFKGVMKGLGVDTVLIPPRNPNSNPVERQNQSLYAALKVDENHGTKDWAKKLPLATLVINCSKSTRTGYSPFFLVFGRQPRIPLDFLSPVPSVESSSSRSYLEFLKNMEDVIKRISTKSKLYLEVQNKHRVQREALRVTDVCYAFFNIVKTDVSKKLQSFYGGPFIVVKKFSDALYELAPFGNNPIKKNQVVARDKIRKIHARTEVLGEEVNFNVFPLPEICPSDEIFLEVDNMPVEKETVEERESEDVVYLSSENDGFELAEERQSDEIQEKESEVEVDNDRVSGDGNREIIPVGEGVEVGVTDESVVPAPVAEGNFDEVELPSEQSFLTTAPPQSSPERLVTIKKSGSRVAKYLWDTGRRLRSQVGGPVVHVQIGTRGRRK